MSKRLFEQERTRELSFVEQEFAAKQNSFNTTISTEEELPNWLKSSIEDARFEQEIADTLKQIDSEFAIHARISSLMEKKINVNNNKLANFVANKIKLED